MLLGDTLILDDLDCANKYRQQVSTLVVMHLQVMLHRAIRSNDF